MTASDAELAVRLARSILDGSMPVLLGCRKMVGPISRLGLDREDPFATFGGVGSETDHLPLDPEDLIVVTFAHTSPHAPPFATLTMDGRSSRSPIM